jgi:hypothetical protein
MRSGTDTGEADAFASAVVDGFGAVAVGGWVDVVAPLPAGGDAVELLAPLPDEQPPASNVNPISSTTARRMTMTVDAEAGPVPGTTALVRRSECPEIARPGL